MNPLFSEKKISFRLIKRGHMAVLILIVAMGMGALVETKELAELTDQLYQHRFKASTNLLEANGRIEEMRALMKDIVVARSDQELDALEDRLDLLEAAANAHFHGVVEAFAGNKTDALSAHQRFKDWKPLRTQIIRLVRAGKYDEALLLNQGKNSDAVDQLANELRGLIDLARSKAESFMRDSKERQYEGRILLLAALLAVVLLTVIISVGTAKRDRESRRELLESEHRLSVAIDNMAVGIVVIKEDGAITEFNPFAERIFGYEAAEVIDKNVRMLIPEPHRSGPDQGLRSYLGTGTDEISGIDRDAEGLRKNGETFPMRLRVGELKAVGGSLFVANIYDLTEIKRLENQLRQSQKMDAIGQLTGGIAHDFNNILGIVMGNLELLQSQVADNAKTLKSVNSALKGAERGASLTKKLLGFSRQSAAEVKLTNLNEFIESLHGLIAKSLTPSIRVEQRLADDLWPVEIDPGDFEDVLLNLSLNARDAMPDGGTLVIETANKTLDEEYIKRNPKARVGEFVMISVSDTGIGMTDAVKEKVFEPFFTTKDQGKGTGLGLSMVYGFVQRSGGHMEILSEPGEGASFILYLPRTQEEVPEEEETIDIQDSVPVGSETILVVDDEEDLADVAVTILESLGYKTFCANDGNQALKILEGNEDIDMLFSDVIMPDGMDGYKLALAAAKIRPDLKILLASGFTRGRQKDVGSEISTVSELTDNLLGKPYNRSELARAIRRTLDEE